MKPSALMDLVIKRIMASMGDGVYMVGVDGVDAAGKTTFAGRLSEELRRRNQGVIMGSMDGFHNPRKHRYKRGRKSPEGYYRDSFNIPALRTQFLEPLRDGLPYRTKVFDYKTDTPINEPKQPPHNAGILVFEGVFSLRPMLQPYWDYMIYLDISPEESLRRGIMRDPGGREMIEHLYRVRYLPGQELYKMEADPLGVAHLVVDYNDPEDPEI